MISTAIAAPAQTSAFQAPADPTPDVEHLFTGAARYIVQTPPMRNDYKKQSGSSDGAKTYDTTST